MTKRKDGGYVPAAPVLMGASRAHRPVGGYTITCLCFFVLDALTLLHRSLLRVFCSALGSWPSSPMEGTKASKKVSKTPEEVAWLCERLPQWQQRKKDKDKDFLANTVTQFFEEFPFSELDRSKAPHVCIVFVFVSYPDDP
jgi:hypothetical protein